jgi:hypothetical protein
LLSEITDARNADRAAGNLQRVIDIECVDLHGMVPFPKSR